jgi:endonuclease/exonuclease/phosphatase family metal-dependent hydrolase
VDHPDIEQSRWWTDEEALVLGAGAGTSDVLRLWYTDHPVELRRRERYYPHGPLADSYHRGRRGQYLRCRYDSIRVSPDISVMDVRYLYDEAVRAGSDHALVVADINLP